MSFCQTCRETVQFYESNGLFYCSQCDSQSETMQVMEYSHFDSQPSQSTGSYPMRAKAIKRSTASKTKVPRPDETPDQPGEDDDIWSFAEVFQLILKKQVDALIKLGVTDKLKEVVEVMWFRYLQNSKWAFVTKQSKQLMGKNGKSGKKKLSTRIKDEQEEDLEGMNSHGNRNKNVPADEEFFKEKNKFRLLHLLGILYAALRFLGEPILVSDLVRWVSDGHLPFYGTSDVLPKHITSKFGCTGSHVFLVAKPDLLHTSKLQEPVSHILNVLDIDLPAFNHIKLDLVIGRFISYLHLPALFHQITHHLMTKFPATADHPQNKKKKKKRKQFGIEEGPSLAYIIVAMKLLFGLDGHTEVLSSEIGRIVRNKLSAGSKVVPFILDEWMACEKLRAKHHQIKTNIFNPQACREVSDVPRFIDEHTNAFLLNSTRETLNRAQKYQGQSLGSEMQRPFMKVRDQGEPSGHPYTPNAPSSFPYPGNGLEERLGGESNSTESDAGTGHGTTSTASGDGHWISKKYLASCNFSKSSVDYLVNLTKFCKKNGLDPESILSDDSLKKIMLERKVCEKADSDVGVSEQKEGKRKKAGSKPGGKGKEKTPSRQDEDVSDPAAASEGTSKDTRTKRKRIRTEEDNTGNTNLKKTMKGAGSDSMTGTDIEELPYEQWKQMVLSRTEKAEGSKVDPSVSCTGLVSYNVSYTRYKPVSVQQAKATMYQDGEPAAWRPFHRSYQWLLEHCAALFRLDWMYIHEAVASLESRIFEL